MRNRFAAGVIAGVVFVLFVALGGGFLLITNGLVGANADAKPGNFERWAARTSLNAEIRREMVRTPNPVAETSANLRDGLKLYGQNCAVCHGNASAKPTTVAKGFYQRAPQLAEDGVEDDPAGVSYWKITHGIRFTAMPAFSKTLTDQQRWERTLFLQQMDKLPPAIDREWHALKLNA